jgi:hypothetical protein
MAIQFVTTLIANRFLLDIELGYDARGGRFLKYAVDLYLITILEKAIHLKTGGRSHFQFSRGGWICQRRWITQDAPKEVGGPFWDQRIIP